MSTETKKETLGFQTEVQQLLHLMIHSLYSNKEIFLRELISNASDALDKLRFEALQDAALFENEPEPGIRVEYDRKQKTISVVDNGIGMSRQEVIDNLGTIARSGTRQFFSALTGDQTRDSQLIGQFGVGFYSSFIVADKVEVVTRRAGAPRNQAVRWISSGENDFTVEQADRPQRGTRVTLYLRDGQEEFLDGARLRSIIGKYSDHISLPIRMPAEGEDAKGDETVNSATALWTRPKKDIGEPEYQEFYKHVAHDFEAPLCWSHNRVEGRLEYISLLFIPARAPFDLWDRERRHGVKLYVHRVFIMDDAEQLLPPYLRFVRGVVDSDDLPLNISREILQNNRTIESIRSGCTRKVLEMLENLAANDAEKYLTFWGEFGRVLKEGIVDTPERREELAGLFRFASTARQGPEQVVSLKDYLARMKPAQKAIFYITAESHALARNSPHLELLGERGVEVLLLSDPVDEWLVAHLAEFDGKPLRSVVRGKLDAGELGEDTRPASTPPETAAGDLPGRFKQALGDRVRDVRATNRLTQSPACLVGEENDMSRHLYKILESSGQKLPVPAPILEINPAHALIGRIASETDDGRFRDWANLIFDQAVLSEGGRLEDAAGFVQRLNRMLLELLGPAKNQ